MSLGKLKQLPALVAFATASLASSALAEQSCLIVKRVDTGALVAQSGTICDTPTSPASTFKVALAAMGYEAGILADANSPAWPYKEDYAAELESWRTTTNPSSWMRDSVVWYSRELVGRLGSERFQDFVNRFDYGNRDLRGNAVGGQTSNPPWISSSLLILPAQQAAFLRKLLEGELPIADRTVQKTIAIVPRFSIAGGWVVQGKTGTALQMSLDGKLDRDRQLGWFIGWATMEKTRIVFVKLVLDEAKIDRPAGLRVRDNLLNELPRLLALL